MVFDELKGKTLTRYQLIDWSCNKNFPHYIKIEDIIRDALQAGVVITGINKEKYLCEGKDENLKGNVKFNKEELLELCRKYGTGKPGMQKIFEELGDRVTNLKQVENYIYRWDIRRILAQESLKAERDKKDESTDQNIQTETGPVKEHEQSAAEDKPTETEQEAPKASEEEIKGFFKAAIELDLEKPKGALRVCALEGEHFYFDLEPAALEISNKEMKAFPPIKYGEELNSLIDNLVEIRDSYINA